MSSSREDELRSAIAVAQRDVATLRLAVAHARIEADPVRHRRLVLRGLAGIGAVALVASFGWGRHVAATAHARQDAAVRAARDQIMLVDSAALRRCTDDDARVRADVAECIREVLTLQPHTRVPRIQNDHECTCQQGDPLCSCR